ncbi:MAG: hypothetical protein AAGJ51_04470 [Pseudomonadota bacterium]
MKAKKMFKKRDVPGDKTPKVQNQDNNPKAAVPDNTNDNVKADKASAEAPTQSTDPLPADKS